MPAQHHESGRLDRCIRSPGAFPSRYVGGRAQPQVAVLWQGDQSMAASVRALAQAAGNDFSSWPTSSVQDRGWAPASAAPKGTIIGHCQRGWPADPAAETTLHGRAHLGGVPAGAVRPWQLPLDCTQQRPRLGVSARRPGEEGGGLAGTCFAPRRAAVVDRRGGTAASGDRPTGKEPPLAAPCPQRRTTPVPPFPEDHPPRTARWAPPARSGRRLVDRPAASQPHTAPGALQPAPRPPRPGVATPETGAESPLAPAKGANLMRAVQIFFEPALPPGGALAGAAGPPPLPPAFLPDTEGGGECTPPSATMCTSQSAARGRPPPVTPAGGGPLSQLASDLRPWRGCGVLPA